MVEKYRPPTSVGHGVFEWRDDNGKLHSYHGFPSLIRVKSDTECQMLWSKHGKILKSLVIDKELEREILLDRIKKRNFIEE